MKTTIRKLLCVAIALVLTVGLLPVSAMASGTTPPCNCIETCDPSSCEACIEKGTCLYTPTVEDPNGNGTGEEGDGKEGSECTCTDADNCLKGSCAVCKDLDECSKQSKPTEENPDTDEDPTCTCPDADSCMNDACEACKGQESCAKTATEPSDDEEGEEGEEGGEPSLQSDEPETDRVESEDGKTVTETTKLNGTVISTVVTEKAEDGTTTVKEYTGDTEIGTLDKTTVTTKSSDKYGNNNTTVTEYAGDSSTFTKKTVTSENNDTVIVNEYADGDDKNYVREFYSFYVADADAADALNLPADYVGKYVTQDTKKADFTSDEKASCNGQDLSYVTTCTLSSDKDRTQKLYEETEVVSNDQSYRCNYVTEYDNNGNIKDKAAYEEVKTDDTTYKLTDTITKYDNQGNVASVQVNKATTTKLDNQNPVTQYETATVTNYETADNGESREVSSKTYQLSGKDPEDVNLDEQTLLSESATTYDADGKATTTTTEYGYAEGGAKTTETVYVNDVKTKTTNFDTDGTTAVSATIYAEDGETAKYVEKYNQTPSEDLSDMGVKSSTVLETPDGNLVKESGTASGYDGSTYEVEYKYSDFTDEEIANCGGVTPNRIESINVYSSDNKLLSTSDTYKSDGTDYLYEDTYNEAEQIAKSTKSKSVDGVYESVETVYTYDNDGKLVEADTYEIYNADGSPVYTSKTTTNYTVTEDGTSLPVSITTYKADGLYADQLTTTIQEAQALTYDEDGNLLSTNTVTYDETGEKVVKDVSTDANGDVTKSTTYAYDENGNLVNLVYEEGGESTTVDYTYTESGKPLSEVRTNSDGSATKVTYEYDDNGVKVKQTREAKVAGTSDFVKLDQTTYDENGQAVETVKYNNDGSVYSTTVYDEKGNFKETIAESGNVIETTFGEGDGENAVATVTTYDKNGTKLSKVVTEMDGETGAVTETTYDGNDVIQSKVVTVYGDNNKVITTTQYENGEETSTVERTIYPTDKDGKHVEEIKTTSADGTVTNEKRTYDSDGRYVKEGSTPEITGQTRTEYSGYAPLLFRSNDDYVNFLGVKVDGEYVDASCYESYAGSIIVSLKQSFLNTLSAGTHYVEIVSTNGSPKASFTISEDTVALVSGTSPRTGDSSNLTLFSALLVLSIGGLMAIPTIFRKKFK